MGMRDCDIGNFFVTKENMKNLRKRAGFKD